MERTLFAVMGNHPLTLPGGGDTHNRFQQIAEYTTSVEVALFIIPDLRGVMGDTQFGNPKWGAKHRTIHSMRLLASRLAKDGDYDWLFVVENDVDLPVNILDRLLGHQKDIAVPRQEFPTCPDFPFMKGMFYQPQEEEGQTGLHRIEWCGYSATLYRMQAFKDVNPMFVGGGEGMDYAWWQDHGIEGWMDLDIEAVNLRLASSQQILMDLPLKYRMHQKTLADDSKERCEGKLHSLSATRIEGAQAAQCEDCGYYIEYRPPKGFRGETLQELGLLESGVGNGRAADGSPSRIDRPAPGTGAHASRSS